MSSNRRLVSRKRTAVLVVHGIGSQRPLDTARGIVKAVWLDGDDDPDRKYWIQPQHSGVDIDLGVITTNGVPGTQNRTVDFHEFYWAHLMSETRGVAVLLWLFELVRKGPRLKPSIKALWWGASIYLALLALAVALLSIQTVEVFANLTFESFARRQHQSMLVAPLVMFLILGIATLAVSLVYRTFKLAVPAAVLAAFCTIFLIGLRYIPEADAFASKILPFLVAFVAMLLLTGRWGVLGLLAAYILSFIFEALLTFVFDVSLTSGEWWPWTLNSSACTVAAWFIIGAYLIINGAFLQPVLGDASRYFRNDPSNVAVRREIRRQAVNTLEQLHESSRYDRIVVVGHSLGSVVAYDMLRAYFGRICRDLPADPNVLGPELDDVDSMDLPPPTLREKGRIIVRAMAKAVEEMPTGDGSSSDDKDCREEKPKAWLVTDFVTLGSPLAHAHYLMCDGHTERELKIDFNRRVREREFPTCPPARDSGDGLLTFTRDDVRRFHHGGVFGLTRWTNLYFPLSELFWGDAIGGALNEVFGSAIFDVRISTRGEASNFFAHIFYWDIDQKEGRKAPHIIALRNAIDLADQGVCNSPSYFEMGSSESPTKTSIDTKL